MATAMGKKHCLVVLAGSDEASVEAAERLSALYYALEAAGITVQFASCEGGEGGGSALLADCLATERRRGGGGKGLRDGGDDGWLRRFARDEAACTRLGQSVALDKAILFKGISFDAVCLCGTGASGLWGSRKLDEIVFLLHRLGRVVSAVDAAVEVLKKSLATAAQPSAVATSPLRGVEDPDDAPEVRAAVNRTSDRPPSACAPSLPSQPRSTDDTSLSFMHGMRTRFFFLFFVFFGATQEFFDCNEELESVQSRPPSRRASLGATAAAEAAAAASDSNVIMILQSAQPQSVPGSPKDSHAHFSVLTEAILSHC